jgi:hypothetical protein
LKCEYKLPESPALLVGQFVDKWFEGKKSFQRFLSDRPDLVNSRTGELKKDYQRAMDMIERASTDEVFMSFTKGRKQVIRTGEIGGLPFKCKMDVYDPDRYIVDIKTVKDFEPIYMPEVGKVSFVEAWHWDIQAAIYQAIEGNKLPVYLACITKQDDPDIAVIQIPQHVLDSSIEFVKEKLPLFDAMRKGIIEPERCGKCDYCRRTHKLNGAISLDELTEY